MAHYQRPAHRVPPGRGGGKESSLWPEREDLGVHWERDWAMRNKKPFPNLSPMLSFHSIAFIENLSQAENHLSPKSHTIIINFLSTFLALLSMYVCVNNSKKTHRNVSILYTVLFTYNTAWYNRVISGRCAQDLKAWYSIQKVQPVQMPWDENDLDKY